MFFFKNHAENEARRLVPNLFQFLKKALREARAVSDCLYFLRYRVMCFAIVCFEVCDIINFEINHIFVIKLFLYMAKNSRQKFKYHL